jgi:hypothetical protein
LEQTPVGLGEALEEFADFEVIGGHGADSGDQFLANVFGDSLVVHFGGEVVAALRGSLMERTLEEIQCLSDLTLELFAAEPQEIMLFAHMYAYNYAYISV